jgi:hypothetical protein
MELMEIRKPLEIQSVVLATDRHTPGDLTKLEETVTVMAKNLHNLETYANLDVEFHLQIAAATRNIMMYYLIGSICEALEDAVLQGLHSRLTVTLVATDIPAGLQVATFPNIFGSDGGDHDPPLNGAQGPITLTYDYPIVGVQPVSNTFNVVVTDTQNYASTAAFGVIRDTTPPVITITVPGKSGLAIPVAWPAHDGLSGLRHYRVQVREDGNPAGWTDWLTATTATQTTFVGTKGVTYTF